MISKPQKNNNSNLRRSLVGAQVESRKPVPPKRYSTKDHVFTTTQGRDTFKQMNTTKFDPRGRDNGGNIRIQENWDDMDVDQLLGKSYNDLGSGGNDFHEVQNRVRKVWKNKTGFVANSIRGIGYGNNARGTGANKSQVVGNKYVISNKNASKGFVKKPLDTDEYCIKQQVFMCGKKNKQFMLHSYFKHIINEPYPDDPFSGRWDSGFFMQVQL